MKTNWLDYTLLTLVIIGAINWGLIGFFRFDLVAFLFGNLSWLSRIVYALVGIGGLYTISPLYFSLMMSSFSIACWISSSVSANAIVRKLSRYISSRS